MNRMPAMYFLISIGLILFVLCISSWGSKEGELFAGILSLYAGTIMLFDSLKTGKYTMYGLRFRVILTGVIGVVVGLVIVVTYFI